jgi:hypothetical protein
MISMMNNMKLVNFKVFLILQLKRKKYYKHTTYMNRMCLLLKQVMTLMITRIKLIKIKRNGAVIERVNLKI